MKNLKIYLISILLLLNQTSISANAIVWKERSDCDKKSSDVLKQSCHQELDKLEVDYKASKASISQTNDLGRDTKSEAKTGAALGVGLTAASMAGAGAAIATSAIGGYQIVGSITLGEFVTADCISCALGVAASVLAFLYKSKISDKYEDKYEGAKKQLDSVYRQGKSTNNGDFQYTALEAEVAAIKMIHEAAVEKSKSHKNLKTMYSAVAAAAAVEIAVCSMPYSGCTASIPKAAITLGFSANSMSLEGKAKGETDERVAQAKTALTATTKLKEKFHQFFEAKADSSAGSSAIVNATGSSKEFGNAGTRTIGVSNSDTSVTNGINDSTVTSNQDLNSGKEILDPNADCVANSGDIVSCGEIGTAGTYDIAKILPSSKYKSEFEEKTNVSGAANIINRGFKGDFSELEKIGDNATFANSENVFRDTVKKLLENPKNLDSEVIKQLEASLKDLTDEELKMAILTNNDPATLAALTHRNLFGGASSEIKLDEVTKDSQSSIVNIEMSEGKLGNKANVAKSAFKEELLDLDGIDSTQTNLDGFEAQTPAGKYQAAINEYMKKRKPGEEIIYNDIHTSKEDSIFDIISNRYKSNHVIHRLSTKKKKDIQ